MDSVHAKRFVNVTSRILLKKLLTWRCRAADTVNGTLSTASHWLAAAGTRSALPSRMKYLLNLSGNLKNFLTCPTGGKIITHSKNKLWRTEELHKETQNLLHFFLWYNSWNNTLFKYYESLIFLSLSEIILWIKASPLLYDVTRWGDMMNSEKYVARSTDRWRDVTNQRHNGTMRISLQKTIWNKAKRQEVKRTKREGKSSSRRRRERKNPKQGERNALNTRRRRGGDGVSLSRRSRPLIWTSRWHSSPPPHPHWTVFFLSFFFLSILKK